MALFFCLKFRDTLTDMIGREQLRAELIGLFDSHGHFKSRVANEKSLTRRGLWEPLVAYSSPDACSPMDRIVQVLLRVDPRCPVCGDRCNRLTGGAVFGFSTCCSSRCRGLAARGIRVVHNGGEFRMEPLDIADLPVDIHDPTLRDERNAFLTECQNTYRTECHEKAITRSRQYHNAHRDEMRAYFKQWRDANPTYSQGYKNSHRKEVRARKYNYYHNHDGPERRRKYWRTHKAKCKAINDKYRLSHPGQHNAAGARRRATKLSATPPWLDQAMKIDIRHVYAAASEMSKRGGVRYQVDHIIPLQGDTVCGLHVPWNLQILTINENASKGNKLLSESEAQACADRMKVVMGAGLCYNHDGSERRRKYWRTHKANATLYVEATMEPKIWEWRIVTDVDYSMPAWQSEWRETDATTWCRLRDELKPGKTCRLEFRTRYADEAA